MQACGDVMIGQHGCWISVMNRIYLWKPYQREVHTQRVITTGAFVVARPY